MVAIVAILDDRVKQNGLPPISTTFWADHGGFFYSCPEAKYSAATLNFEKKVSI